MRIAIAAGLAAACTACVDHVVHQAEIPLPDGRWPRNLTPEFAFEITDTVSKHNLFIDLRHTGDYAYSSLFLFVDLHGPGGRHLRDTVECLLADPTGRWYGRGTGYIFAGRVHAKVLYKTGNRFPAAGRYTLRMEQAMRTDTLNGVLNVGMSVERSP
jgi:gliding motility-associated lipoprotein GldH